MLKASDQSESDRQASLKLVEVQINRLEQMLDTSAGTLRFDNDIESKYLVHRNLHFLRIDLKIIFAGLLTYLMFGLADIFVGFEQTENLFLVRAMLTGLMLGVLFAFYNTRYRVYLIPVTAAGIAVIGMSVIYYISLLEGLPRYAYHLGLVPVQVFAMVTLRLSYRSFLMTSLAMLLVYLSVYSQLGSLVDDSEMSRTILALQPFFVVFWVVMIVMGGYLSYMMEASFRRDYLKNCLLAHEAERLQLLTQRLQYLSTTDGLTQVANRRHFEQEFEREWRRCQRSSEPLSLIMLDVDEFKQYNDSNGHLMGDECLKQIASVMLQQCRRSSDLCARYGGEEFIVLLPNMTPDDAASLAEVIRETIQHLNITHNHSDLGIVTVSAGVAGGVPRLGQSPEDFIRRADELLYQAKGSGRNRVRL